MNEEREDRELDALLAGGSDSGRNYFAKPRVNPNMQTKNKRYD